MKKSYPNEKAYLADYNIHDYDIPLATVDLTIFTLHQEKLKVLLVKRSDFPFKNSWALPGGFIDVRQDRNIEHTALRKLLEKTGVASPYLEQLCTVGNATRDPRGWSITVAYFALIPYVDALKTQAEDQVKWITVEEAISKKLAFDHANLVEIALERIRSKVLYSLIPAQLIPSPFTLSALQNAYEIILGKSLEKKAFRRRLENAEVLESLNEMNSERGGRPAALYQLKSNMDAFNFNRQING